MILFTLGKFPQISGSIKQRGTFTLFLRQTVNWPTAGPVGFQSSLFLTLLAKIYYFLSALGCLTSPAPPWNHQLHLTSVFIPHKKTPKKRQNKLSEPCALNKQPRPGPKAPRAEYVGGVEDGKQTQMLATKHSSQKLWQNSIASYLMFTVLFQDLARQKL